MIINRFSLKFVIVQSRSTSAINISGYCSSPYSLLLLAHIYDNLYFTFRTHMLENLLSIGVLLTDRYTFFAEMSFNVLVICSWRSGGCCWSCCWWWWWWWWCYRCSLCFCCSLYCFVNLVYLVVVEVFIFSAFLCVFGIRHDSYDGCIRNACTYRHEREQTVILEWITSCIMLFLNGGCED